MPAYSDLLRPLLVLGLIAGLGACGSQPITQQAGSAAAQQAADDPYLRNQQPVSAALEARFERANRALESENYSTAEAAYREILKQRPDLSGPWLNLALISLYRGDEAAAEQHFVSAIEANPNNLAAYNRYAIYLREAGNLEQAQRVYLQALEVWQDHPVTHYNLAILYDLYLGEWEQALYHFQRYQQLSPGEDRRVAGWIMDLQRRMPLLAAEGGAVE